MKFGNARHRGLSVFAAALAFMICAPAASADETCKGLFKLHSQNSKTPTSTTFVNNAKTMRGIMWLDFSGQPKDFANLAVGQSITLKTFLTHPWMVVTGPGDCLQIVMPRSGGSTIRLVEVGAGSVRAAPPRKADAGCWYAVYTCSRSKATDGPGFTVQSDKYAGFGKGLYCNIGGPFPAAADAQSQINRFGGTVKRTC